MSKIRYSSRTKIIEDSAIFDQLINDNCLSTDGKTVLLTKDNARIVEELIKNDDDYFPFSQTLFEHYGINKIQHNAEKSLFAVAREIDRDNSTNVWRYKTNRNSFYNMISFISNPKNHFFDRLKSGDTELPDCIVQECGNGLKSLSSKICKYLCEFAFHKDNYYINDSFVRHILLFYLDYYEIKHQELKSCNDIDHLDYIGLHRWLSALHTSRNQKYKDTITKSELDHILWYCYKSFEL